MSQQSIPETIPWYLERSGPGPEGLRARFNSLLETWKAETAPLSDTGRICSHWAYQQIVGMGPLGLPFIFEEMRRSPPLWFWALRAITGENPVPPEHRGNIKAMTDDWLHWAGDEGLLG